MRFDAFTSGFYSFPSLDAAAQMTMNYYPDLVEGSLPTAGVPQGGEKARKVLTPTPGISLFVTLPHAPVRGFAVGGDGFLAVGGAYLYTVTGVTPFYAVHGYGGLDGAGSVGNDNLPAQIIKNTGEALVMSAGNVFVDQANTLTQCKFSSQLYDLVINSSGYLTGDTGGIFDQTDVGATVVINMAAGAAPPGSTWNIGTYTINVVNGDGSAGLSSSPGTSGSMGGSGYEYSPVAQALSGLAIDAATGGLTGYAFQAGDVGCFISISSGTGFTVQTTFIESVVAGEAFAFGAGWGTWGSTGGAGTITQPAYLTAAQIAYLDGTYFASQADTNVVYYSANSAESNQPGVSWDMLNFFTKEAYPDAVNALFADHEQLYLLGAEQSTEVWSNTGSGTNPYQRNPSYFIHYGCQAAFSVCRLGGGVAWIGGESSRGQRVAFLATGYVPQRISTAAIEKAWGAYAAVADAVAYTIIQDGHETWKISFPTANATWAYDNTLGEWHQEGCWNGAGWDRARGAFHACIGIGTRAEVHYLGDWSTGDIYTTAATNLQDGLASGAVNIHRRRRAPHMSNEKKRRFYARFQLDADNGLSDIEGAARRVFWNRLGASRDRIFQVDDDGSGDLTLSYSDDNCGSFITRSAINVGSAPRAVTLVAAYLEFVDGTG